MDDLEVGDAFSFRAGDVLPSDDPLAEWLVLLAMSLNDVALVNARLEQDYESPHEYLYWLRLGIAHFFEGAKLLKRAKQIPKVKSYIDSLPPPMPSMYATCVSIYDERHEELKMMRDVLFHYHRTWTRSGHREDVVRLALEQFADKRTTIKTGTLRDARLLFADDVVAMIFVRATGVSWPNVANDQLDEKVERVQARIQEAVTAFVRFANPALQEHVSRMIESGVPIQKVELVDPDDPRRGWRAAGG